ncbi:hypothetical protein CS542_08710 [Pedobacter sp. IW39]|nr:hypothetical protein CS542_08710 [Pedobacter sp. IW39]
MQFLRLYKLQQDNLLYGIVVNWQSQNFRCHKKAFTIAMTLTPGANLLYRISGYWLMRSNQSPSLFHELLCQEFDPFKFKFPCL